MRPHVCSCPCLPCLLRLYHNWVLAKVQRGSGLLCSANTGFTLSHWSISPETIDALSIVFSPPFSVLTSHHNTSEACSVEGWGRRRAVWKKREKGRGGGWAIAVWESSFWNILTHHHHHAPFSSRVAEIGALCENAMRAFRVHAMSRSIQSKKGEGWDEWEKERGKGGIDMGWKVA